MARLTNCIFILLNCILLASGFAAVSVSARVQFQGGTDCQRALQTPLLVTGLFLAIVSWLGLTGSCCKANFLLWIYLFTAFILVLGLIVFTIFVLIVTTKSSDQRAYPNRLQDYSHWLKGHFVSGKSWEEIKSCLIDAQICNNHDNVDIKHWSLTQSGCCKPPTFCEFEKINATFWRVRRREGTAEEDSDCLTWNNEPKKLCFYCNSCKGGVLSTIRRQWRELAVFNVAIIAVVLIIFSIGCCVRRNNQCDQYVKYSSYSNWPEH